MGVTLGSLRPSRERCSAQDAILSDYFEREWKIAAIAEVQRRRGSPIRAQHQPLIYDAAVDLGYWSSVIGCGLPESDKPSLKAASSRRV